MYRNGTQTTTTTSDTVDSESGDMFLDTEVDEDEEEETDADYRARIMHVDTFLRLNESISSLKEIGEHKPEYAVEVRKLLESSFESDNRRTIDSSPQSTSHCTSVADITANANDSKSVIKVTAHAHLIYHGDLLQLSKETVTLTISKRDMTLFTRIINCFKLMILGRHTDEDVANMRRDHDALIAMWDETPNKSLNVGSELNNMMRSMLATPLYYSNSCMAMIACGQMLRNLYTNTEGVQCDTYEQLMCFVRKHMRHNAADPFACDCHGLCSIECKTLMSMIMEVPAVAHNQTYLLQTLAYLMYDKSGREEVFINNLKNTCSPGLLDRIPTRVAMLMGTLDEVEIVRRYRSIRKAVRHLDPLRGRTAYSKNALDRLLQLVHHPRVQALIDRLPGAACAAVELRLPKCDAEKRQCLNKEFDGKSIADKTFNNNGKNKCCGYLRQDPFDILVSSISLAQLAVYLFFDPRTGSAKSRKHFFIRDILTALARQTVKIKVDTLEEMFCYLDRTRVFKSFNEHPFMMSALQELFTTYIDYMKDAAEKYKESGKKRRMKRYLKKNGVSDATLSSQTHCVAGTRGGK